MPRRPADNSLRIRMQYIGALNLLGRMARHVPKGHDDRDLIERALRDGVEALPNFEAVQCSDGSYAFEVTREQVSHV